MSTDSINPTTTTTTIEALAAHGAAIVLEAAAGGADHVEQAVLAVQWAHQTFDSLVLMSSMGDEALVHLASEAAPGLQVAFIDMRLLTVTPAQTVAEQDAQYGSRLHERDPDLCCALRKVEPLERTLAGRDAWITGMRRIDAPTRTDIDIVGVDARRGMVKINPLALWTEEQTREYARDAGVLLNPLREIGYTSIGCGPCTRPTAPGEDPRAGRWAGKAKTECGLHV